MRGVSGQRKARASSAFAADSGADTQHSVKRRVNGRAKGAGFERDIATDLRAWLGPEWAVSRTPTDRQRSQDRSGHAGEFTIEPPKGSDRTFPFAIECKAHKTFDLRQLWRVPVDGPLAKWWAQTIKQADAVDRIPLLIVKVARGETLAFRRLDLDHRTSAPSALVTLPGALLRVVPWSQMETEIRAIATTVEAA